MLHLRFPTVTLALCASLASAVAGCGGDSFSSEGGAAGAAGASGAGGSAGGGGGSAGSGGADASAGGGGGAGKDGGGADVSVNSDGGAGKDGGGGGAGTDGASGDGSGGGGLDGSSDAGPGCDPSESPTGGIFVSESAPAGGDGSAALPFKTIAAGLDAASKAGGGTVYLAPGTYGEPVDFGAQHAGILVRGGVTRLGSVWKYDCDPEARKNTVIASPAAVGVHVGQLAKPSGLRTLLVYSKAACASQAGKPGESCYGVVIMGAGTHFTLNDVEVTAGTGGAGGLATATVPAKQVSCDGLTNCGDGASGGPGSSGGTTSAGTFNLGGYAPGNGGNAGAGTAGANGKNGTGGATGTNCPTQCSGGLGSCNSNDHFCGNIDPQTITAGTGTCGCGGKGGDGGGGGFGGGASVALFVAGNGAQVDLVSSVLFAKNGGNGSHGVLGLLGAAGTGGSAGADAYCPGDCKLVQKPNNQCNCEQPTGTPLLGGTAGGLGGTGGKGGDGGGGSGGPSYGIVRVGGAQVTADAPVASFTTPGQGGAGVGAPNGGSGAELAVP